MTNIKRKSGNINFPIGTAVWHPFLGNADGIVVAPDTVCGTANYKKVYVATQCSRVYTFCPYSLTKIDMNQISQEMVA